jgi:hypothetical protein
VVARCAADVAESDCGPRLTLITTRQHARSQHVTLRLAEHNGMVEMMLIDDAVVWQSLDAGRGHAIFTTKCGIAR